MGDAGEKLVGIIGAIIGLAVLAIVISARANTANVLTSFFSGLSNLIGVAISPITGQQVANLSGGLQGGAWSTGQSGFSLNGGTYGVNVGGVGQIANAAGGFAGGLVKGLMGGAYGYSGGGTNFAGAATSLFGGAGGAAGAAGDASAVSDVAALASFY